MAKINVVCEDEATSNNVAAVFSKAGIVDYSLTWYGSRVVYGPGPEAQSAERRIGDGQLIRWLLENVDNIRKLIDLFGGIGSGPTERTR